MGILDEFRIKTALHLLSQAHDTRRGLASSSNNGVAPPCLPSLHIHHLRASQPVSLGRLLCTHSNRKESTTNTLSSIAGWAGATVDPAWFVKEQTSTPSVTVDDNSRLVALQLGNCYGLLFLAAVAVLYTTTELKVVRNYLIALWIADIGHIAVCYFGLGFERFVDVASWNSSKQSWIRSLTLQDQTYPVFTLYNKDFTGCRL